VTVLRQVGRFDAAWNRLPAVQEEDFHGITSPTGGMFDAKRIAKLSVVVGHLSFYMLG
jgi:hypothetical protein